MQCRVPAAWQRLDRSARFLLNSAQLALTLVWPFQASGPPLSTPTSHTADGFCTLRAPSARLMQELANQKNLVAHWASKRSVVSYSVLVQAQITEIKVFGGHRASPPAANSSSLG